MKSPPITQPTPPGGRVDIIGGASSLVRSLKNVARPEEESVR